MAVTTRYGIFGEFDPQSIYSIAFVYAMLYLISRYIAPRYTMQTQLMFACCNGFVYKKHRYKIKENNIYHWTQLLAMCMTVLFH